MIIYKDIISGALRLHVLTLPTAALLMFILLSSLFTSFCRSFWGLFFDNYYFNDYPYVQGDELFSDAYPLKLVNDLYYEVEGKVRDRL